MTCELCNLATATMWVVGPSELLTSCDDCGPQAGYKILAPLESVGGDHSEVGRRETHHG